MKKKIRKVTETSQVNVASFLALQIKGSEGEQEP